MKKLLKIVWNLIIMAIVLSIFPAILMIDVIRVHFAYFF